MYTSAYVRAVSATHIASTSKNHFQLQVHKLTAIAMTTEGANTPK